MFRKLWRARREITTLIDDAMKAAEDKQITKAEIDQLTADLVKIVNSLRGDS